MRSTIAAALLFAATLPAQQTNTGVIFGILSDSVAHLVASAPITARNVETGQTYAFTSGGSGEFRLTGLPAGEYAVSVHINTVGDFPQPPMKVTANASLRLDIILPLP